MIPKVEHRTSGIRKAAILMTIMGEEAAAAVYRHLPDEDVQLVTRELAEIGFVPDDVKHHVLDEYSQLALTQDYIAQGGKDFARRLLVKAFGVESATNLLAKVERLRELSASQLDSLQKADPQQLATFLDGEHPQTIALVLAHLDSKQASSLLMMLPDPMRAGVIKRLAQLRQFSPEMAQKISVVLNRRLQSLGAQSQKTYAGLKSVADVMNRLDAQVSKTVLEAIEQDDPKLAISIRNLMFTFEDLVGIPDVSVREWLGTMDKKTLAMALKGATPELKDHIFRFMSSRAVEMLKEDMETLGPVRSKDVSQAQQEAVIQLRKLEAEGKIVLKAEGDDEYVV